MPLRYQINVLGTRPPEELTYIRSDQALDFLKQLPQMPTVPWSTLFPEASEKALHLLNEMLQFHPSKRITVDAALAHPYFDSVRAQYTDPEPVLEQAPGAFDFSFEYDDKLGVEDFRRLISEEAASFRAGAYWLGWRYSSAQHAAPLTALLPRVVLAYRMLACRKSDGPPSAGG